MSFIRYSIKEAIQTWGGGLIWLSAIMGGWALVSIWSHFLDDVALISSTVTPAKEELNFLLGGIAASWCWICIRAVLSPEPTWQKTLWIATYCAGCWWLGSSPLFDHSFGFIRGFEYHGSPIFNAAHGTGFILMFGAVWLAHPLVQQILLSTERQALVRSSSTIWLNRWVLRCIVLVAAIYGGRILLPLISRSSIESWEYEPCSTEHIAVLVLVAGSLLLPLRVLAIVNRVWFQFLFWPFLLAGFAFLALLASPVPAEFHLPFVLPFATVLCVQFWIANILRFRVVVPRSLDASSVDPKIDDARRPIDRKTMALAYSGATAALLIWLTGLTVLKENVCLSAYRIASSDPWKTSKLVLKCKTFYLAHPIPKEDVLAWEIEEAPLQINYDDSIQMLVSKSLSESPEWEAFHQVAERELPIRFRYVYPISNAADFAANVGGSVIQFDQAKRPLREYVRMQNNFPSVAGKIVVIGGVITNADLDLLPSPNLEFVGCHFLADAEFYPRASTSRSAILFRDCKFEASAYTSLTESRSRQRNIVMTDHEKPSIDPDWLIDGVVNGIEIEFPNASSDWTPEWLAASRTNRGMFVALNISRVGLRLGLAPPWDFLLSESPKPPLLSGKLRTDNLGQIVGIHWDGFSKREIPIQTVPEKLRERDFTVPWLVISGSELTAESEPRLATLVEIIKKSRFVRFEDIIDPTALAKLSEIYFENETPPAVIQYAGSLFGAPGIEWFPWVETVVSDRIDLDFKSISQDLANPDSNVQGSIPEECLAEVKANAAALPRLKKVIFLVNSETTPASFTWTEERTGKSVLVELVPTKPDGTWQSALGLAE
jgi:hypothetical protein